MEAAKNSYPHEGFGAALEHLEAGRKVARAGWNGKGMWLALTPGSVIPASMARSGAVLALANSNGMTGETPITICPHIDMKAADGSVVPGWLASQTDMLAKDWMIVE